MKGQIAKRGLLGIAGCGVLTPAKITSLVNGIEMQTL
jgi:hypothetical protein